jgi:hypothetical protein
MIKKIFDDILKLFNDKNNIFGYGDSNGKRFKKFFFLQK